MESEPVGHERRASARVCAHGRMVIRGVRGEVGAIDDVSMSGVRFHTEARDTHYDLAERVEIDLRFDGARGGWCALTGVIHRIDDGERFVVIFDPPPAGLEEGLVRALRAALPEAVVHVLLCDPIRSRRGRVARAMRAGGRRVHEASSPLEVIAYLDSGAFPRLVAIADTSPAGIADDLRRYLADEHGELPLLRVDDDDTDGANARMDDDGGRSGQ